MIRGYFLNGIKQDHILVFRSDDPEDLLKVIDRLRACRDKEIRALADKLEISWNERQYNNKDAKK